MIRIKELRKQRGLPIEVLAYRARVSARTVWLWETHGIPPRRRETAQRIADALQVSLTELGYDSQQEGDTP